MPAAVSVSCTRMRNETVGGKQGREQGWKKKNAKKKGVNSSLGEKRARSGWGYPRGKEGRS
jgi:hypothetical protein